MCLGGALFCLIIGAHATVSKFELITRDPAKYKTYYPQLTLIQPDSVNTPDVI